MDEATAARYLGILQEVVEATDEDAPEVIERHREALREEAFSDWLMMVARLAAAFNEGIERQVFLLAVDRFATRLEQANLGDPLLASALADLLSEGRALQSEAPTPVYQSSLASLLFGHSASTSSDGPAGTEQQRDIPQGQEAKELYESALAFQAEYQVQTVCMQFINEFNQAKEAQELEVIARHRATLVDEAFSSWLESFVQRLIRLRVDEDGEREGAAMLGILADRLEEASAADPELEPAAKAVRAGARALGGHRGQIEADQSRYQEFLLEFIEAPTESLDPLFLSSLQFLAEAGWLRWLERSLDAVMDDNEEAGIALALRLGSVAGSLRDSAPEVLVENELVAWQAALAGLDSTDRRDDWAAVQDYLGDAYANRRRGDRVENLERAIECYQKALKVRTKEETRKDWAVTQYSLGSAYQDRLSGDRAENLERAIECYQQVLEVRNRETDAEAWARTLNALGNAYALRMLGDQAENIERAIDCYRSALTVRTREEIPYDWAMTQMNLGGAYTLRRGGDRVRNLESAIACLEQALQVCSEGKWPDLWTSIQNNLGNAYRERILGERWQNLERAIQCCERALEVRTREVAPHDWAGTQLALGNAYLDRLVGERGRNVEEAIGCFQRALEVFTKGQTPFEWAKTLNGLGSAYSQRVYGERWQNLEWAIECYNRALEVDTREQTPQSWAGTQMNLGIAYRERILGEKWQNLESAIECFSRTLGVFTKEQTPHEWSLAEMNLGVTYRHRLVGERSQNIQWAIRCSEKALEVQSWDEDLYGWTRIQNNLGALYWDDDRPEEAIGCFRHACLGFVLSRDLAWVCQVGRSLGSSLLRRYEHSGDQALAQQAYEGYLLGLAAAQSVRGEAVSPQERRRLLEELARAALGAAHLAVRMGEIRVACALVDTAKGAELRERLLRDPDVALRDLPEQQQTSGRAALGDLERQRWLVQGLVERLRGVKGEVHRRLAEEDLRQAEEQLRLAEARVQEFIVPESLREAEALRGVSLELTLAQLLDGLREQQPGEDFDVVGYVGPELTRVVKEQAEIWLREVGKALSLPPAPRTVLSFGVTDWATHLFRIQAYEDQVEVSHWETDFDDDDWLDALTVEAVNPYYSLNGLDKRPFVHRFELTPSSLLTHLLSSQIGDRLEQLLSKVNEWTRAAGRVVLVPHRWLHLVPWPHLPLDPFGDNSPCLADKPVSVLPALFLGAHLARSRSTATALAGTEEPARRLSTKLPKLRVFSYEGAEHLLSDGESGRRSSREAHNQRPVILGEVHAQEVRGVWEGQPGAWIEELTAREPEAQDEAKWLIDQASRSEVLALYGHGHFDPDEPLQSGFLLANGQLLRLEQLYQSLEARDGQVATVTSCVLGRTALPGTAADPLVSLPWAFLVGGFPQVIAGHHPVSMEAGVLVTRWVHEGLSDQLAEGSLDAPAALSHALQRLRRMTVRELIRTLEEWQDVFPEGREEEEGPIEGRTLGVGVLGAKGELVSDRAQLASWLKHLRGLDPDLAYFARDWSEVAPLIVYGM